MFILQILCIECIVLNCIIYNIMAVYLVLHRIYTSLREIYTTYRWLNSIFVGAGLISAYVFPLVSCMEKQT